MCVRFVSEIFVREICARDFCVCTLPPDQWLKLFGNDRYPHHLYQVYITFFVGQSLYHVLPPAITACHVFSRTKFAILFCCRPKFTPPPPFFFLLLFFFFFFCFFDLHRGACYVVHSSLFAPPPRPACG